MHFSKGSEPILQNDRGWAGRFAPDPRLIFLATLLPFVLTALAPEDRCFRVFPVGFDDMEVIPVDDLLAGDDVAAIATPERHLRLHPCFGEDGHVSSR